jgi:PhnB protein
MPQLNAYLKFSGNCRDAFEFYAACLGGELVLQTVKESPMAQQLPPESQEKILHASLTAGNMSLFGSDMIGPDGLKDGTNIFLCYIGTLDEIKAAFNNLAVGGNITHPLKEEFFGTFGDLTDKFDMNWMFQADKQLKPAS